MLKWTVLQPMLLALLFVLKSFFSRMSISLFILQPATAINLTRKEFHFFFKRENRVRRTIIYNKFWLHNWEQKIVRMEKGKNEGLTFGAKIFRMWAARRFSCHKSHCYPIVRGVYERGSRRFNFSFTFGINILQNMKKCSFWMGAVLHLRWNQRLQFIGQIKHQKVALAKPWHHFNSTLYHRLKMNQLESFETKLIKKAFLSPLPSLFIAHQAVFVYFHCCKS